MNYPFHAYKFMRAEHAKALLNDGLIRVGTLYEYRNTEIHGLAIGDADEGKAERFFDIRDRVSWSRENMPDFPRKFFNYTADGNISLSNITLVERLQSKDVYLYCVSRRFDQRALVEFGYDTCVRISFPGKFMRAISRALTNTKYHGLSNCIYRNRSIPHDERFTPALLKDKKYAAQSEMRGIWEPADFRIKPEFLEIPELRRYVSIIKPRPQKIEQAIRGVLSTWN